MITDLRSFVDYFARIRKRTMHFLAHIPPDQVDFTPHPGKFTFGDLIRHLGSAEAMFTAAVLHGGWTYPGHQRALGPTYAAAVGYLERTHADCTARLLEAPAEVLTIKRQTYHGHPVSGWHLLMGMAEHEVHHRAQVSQYLVALGVEPPQVFGLRIEQVGSGHSAGPPDAS